ncbi:hypothetical protein BS47DRAFT_1286605, partial [Hydnum rufescens UP504]
SKSDLTKQLQELKTELLSLSLHVQKIASLLASKLSQISTVHKSIARVLTVMNKKACQNLQEYYKNKKYLPLDLHIKKTHAICCQLTRQSGKMEKQHKQDIHFPTVKGCTRGKRYNDVIGLNTRKCP